VDTDSVRAMKALEKPVRRMCAVIRLPGPGRRDKRLEILGLEIGGGGRTRTYDLRIMRPSL
jgi:hypothetical protein